MSSSSIITIRSRTTCQYISNWTDKEVKVFRNDKIGNTRP